MRQTVRTTAQNIIITLALAFAVGVVIFHSWGSILSYVLSFVLIVIILHLFISARTGIWCEEGEDEFAVRSGFCARRAYRISDIERLVLTPWCFVIVFKWGTLYIPAVGMKGFNDFSHTARLSPEIR